MKKIIAILYILVSFYSSFGQAVQNRSNSVVTVQDSRWMAGLNAFIPRYADTTAANLNLGIDSCGAIIYTYTNLIYYRGCSPKRWLLMGTGQLINDTIYTRIPIAVDTTTIPGKRILFLLHLNGLESGGKVTLDSCMTLDVSAPVYYINYKQYSIAAKIGLVVQPSDVFDRTDAVVADSAGNIIVLKGLIGNIPPYVDPSSQILLATVPVGAGVTCLGINQEIIYDQHRASEWIVTTSGTLSNNADNIVNPYHLDTANRLLTYLNGAQIIYTKPSGIDTAVAGELLKFFIYFNGVFHNQIVMQWYNGSTAVSNPIVINPYFNPNDTSFYQLVVVPLSAWNFTNTSGYPQFNRLVITFVGSDVTATNGLFHDWIQLQSGIGNINTVLTLTTLGTSGAATLINNTLNIPVYSGGSGGTGTLQIDFDNAPTASPQIGAHGNPIAFDSTDFSTVSYNGLYTELFSAGSTLSSFNNTYNIGNPSSSQVQIGQSISDTTVVNAYMRAEITDYQGNIFSNGIDVNPTFTQFSTIGTDTHTRVVFTKVDTLLTLPTYVYVPDADTLKVYPFPSGGGGGTETWQQTLINGSQFSQDNTIEMNGNDWIMEDGSGLNFHMAIGEGRVSFVTPGGIEAHFSDDAGGIQFVAPKFIVQGGSNKFLEINPGDSVYRIGDFDGVGNNTNISIDDIAKSIEYTADTHTFDGSIVYNTPLSGAITDSILTRDASTGIVNMINRASLFQTIDQTLRTGNTTKQIMMWVDSTATDSTGIPFTEYRPRNYLRTYGVLGTGAAFRQGYDYFPGVNIDGRPNVVGIMWSYNPTAISGEATWGFRTETWYDLASGGNSEFHLPEFKSTNGVTRRPDSYYIVNSNGYTVNNHQVDEFTLFQGATDTTMFSITPASGSISFRINAALLLNNSRIPSNSLSIYNGDNGAVFSLGGGVAPASSYFSFNSPLFVQTSGSIGTSNLTAIQTNVGGANYSGLRIEQQGGMTAANFLGVTAPQINTSGAFNILNGYNSGTGSISTNLAIGVGGIAYHYLGDGGGNGFAIMYKSGTLGTPLLIGPNGDSSIKIRMDTKNVYLKYSTVAGSGSIAPTSTLSVNGSFGAAYVAKTGTYTITASDYTIEATTGTFTTTLPTAVGIAGRIYVITNSGTGVITVGTTSSQTFANVLTTPTTLTLSQFNTVTVQSNGANWLRLTNL